MQIKTHTIVMCHIKAEDFTDQFVHLTFRIEAKISVPSPFFLEFVLSIYLVYSLFPQELVCQSVVIIEIMIKLIVHTSSLLRCRQSLPAFRVSQPWAACLCLSFSPAQQMTQLCRFFSSNLGRGEVVRRKMGKRERWQFLCTGSMLSPLGSLSWGLTLEGVKTEMWLEIPHSNGSGHLCSTPL